MGLDRHPDHLLVSGIGVCKLGVLCHTQIMTSDAAHVWLGAPVFQAITLATRSQAVSAAVQTHKPWHNTQRYPDRA